jgi:hypothetical protein
LQARGVGAFLFVHAGVKLLLAFLQSAIHNKIPANFVILCAGSSSIIVAEDQLGMAGLQGLGRSSRSVLLAYDPSSLSGLKEEEDAH